MLLDAAVGFGFLVVALGHGKAPAAMRWWWASVGIAWWLGGLEPLRLVHQGVLIAALAVFPTGRARSASQLLALGIGAVAATGLLGQPGAAAGFLVTAEISRRRAAFASVAAAVVGLWLAGSLLWSRVAPDTFQPSHVLVGYEVLVLLVALALPAGLWAHAQRRSALGDRVLAAGPTGFAGLEVALRHALSRPALRLSRHGDEIVVEGLGRADAETVAAVDRAIALAAAHEQAMTEAAHRLRQLEAVRSRLIAAADVERRRAGERLRRELAALRACRARLSGVPDLAREVGAAAADIERIVAGLPPDRLGGGRIGPALARLCARHPVPVSLELDEQAAGDLATETALFYAASEALANSLKHARARAVAVRLQAGDELLLTIVDDGAGGVDGQGTGLVNLQDRLAAVGGSLSLDDRGSGTRLVARVPRTSHGAAQPIRT